MAFGALESSPLRNLFELRQARSRRVSSWDRTGGNRDWIAVGPEFRGRGYGGALMEIFIEGVRDDGGRLAVIETSSLPGYSDARRLYLRHGFQEKARLEGYYGEGDDLIIYTQGLSREER